MSILCVRTFEKSMSLTDTELSLHHDLEDAVKNRNVKSLLACKFYELVTTPRSDIFHAACRALRDKRDRMEQETQEKETELRFAASTLGIALEEED